MESSVDGGGEFEIATHTMPASYAQDRNRLQYELTVRQEPKQARMCGIGGKADRRPIDPPVIVQLRVIDPAANGPAAANTPSAPAEGDQPASGDETDEPPYTNLPGYAQSFLQNPYYFMFASLAKPDDDTELHWLKDGRTRCTTGSVVSSLYALKDPTAGTGKDKDGGPTTASPASDAGFFVFPDLSVRTEGSYRLKLSLFEVVGNDVRHCKSIYSAPFYVYTAKKFPGVEESSPLTCSLADQGIKIRIRKDIRMRKARSGGERGLLPIGGERGGGLIDPPSDMGSLGMPTVDPDPPVVDDSKNQNSHRPAKRSRIDDGTGNTGGAPPVGAAWPSAPLIPPPPGAEIQGLQGQQQSSQGQGTMVIPPPPPPVANHNGPPPQDVGYDGRVAPYAPFDTTGDVPPVPSHQPQHATHQQQHLGQQQQHIPPPPPPGYRADMPPPPPPPHAHPAYAPPHPPPHPAQYQHPYYTHAYPPPWAGAYNDPYAHPHPHPHQQHQHQQYAPPPPPPMRYDYGYPPPPPPPHYPYYDQQGYDYSAQYGAPPPQGPGQQQPGGQAQGAMSSTPTVPSMGMGPPPNPTMNIGQGQGMAPNGGGLPQSNPNMGAPQNSNHIAPANPTMVPSMAGANMMPGSNPSARPPPPPPQQYYRPYIAPPYYPYAQPQHQHQPQHEPPAWGTPPSGFPPPPVAAWGDYAQQPQAQQQQPLAQPLVGGSGTPTGHQQVQGQVGALRSPNARIELAPLRPREEESAGGPNMGTRGGSPQGAHAVIQIRSGSATRGSREVGKKNPLSIGSIISEETEDTH